MDVQQILLILVFFATVFTIIKEPKIKRIKIDYGIAPLLAILVLLLIGLLNFSMILEALQGINNLVPWQIILIFFTAAYVCISLDTTGFFEYLSFRVLKFSKNNGYKLFFYLILFTACLTIFTSNDVVTLTMTPLILYLSKHSKINPLPYLIAVFFASNTWSMILYIGSPTNIIVAQALNLSFFEYSKLMFIPTIVAGVITSLLVFFVFRKQIERKIRVIKKLDHTKYIRNKVAAVVSVVLFSLFFVSLLFSEYLNLEIWQVTTGFALFFLVVNLLFSFHHWKTKFQSHQYHHQKTKLMMLAHNWKFKVNEFFVSFHRMPWKILPLITSFFIIIHLFTIYGLTNYLAILLSKFTGIFSEIFFTGILSAITANIMIDQPMTMFFAQALNGNLNKGLALIVGANLGDNLTLFGALAGLMWIKMLKFNKIEMSYKKFLSYSILIIPVVIVITLFVLALQMKLLF
ncbi:arsenic transporter [Candidatus Woesearchaeota archaeon]|nr:arsenic transporter [Candidatus Woesearchaeota archaeon]MBT4110492.1 arsenic transporter [Candidatus Woesearchaeota archaeon]MBT4335984.1 arsenic transporter [Candidatus Woesearchaeota archaeon]MBT4469037.1 arsenic transporter [Candidatus Woesearchaeota archaeon]MBT6744644.1 arsenic transporter [Candidatus Woesearchaeota archaeon]